MKITEIIQCHGHPNILAHHKSTFEITRANSLTIQGDCIIGVGADKGCLDLSQEFKNALQNPHAILTTVLEAGDVHVTIKSNGSKSLTLTHPTDLVWRKSTFTCGRTIGILSDTAACDIPRDFIAAVQSGTTFTATLTVQY